MLRMNPARILRVLASAIGLTAAPVPAIPEVGYHLPRGKGPPVPRRRRERPHRANRRRLKGQRNALCHHTRWTVRRGSLARTHDAWVAGIAERQAACERMLKEAGL